MPNLTSDDRSTTTGLFGAISVHGRLSSVLSLVDSQFADSLNLHFSAQPGQQFTQPGPFGPGIDPTTISVRPEGPLVPFDEFNGRILDHRLNRKAFCKPNST